MSMNTEDAATPAVLSNLRTAPVFSTTYQRAELPGSCSMAMGCVNPGRLGNTRCTASDTSLLGASPARQVVFDGRASSPPPVGGVTGPVVALAAAGIFYAYRLYVGRPELSEAMARRFPGLHALLVNKFYVDEIYDAIIVGPLERISRTFLWRGIDVGVIDGLVNGTASLAVRTGHLVKKMQTGYARTYAAWILLGAVVVLAYSYFAG